MNFKTQIALLLLTLSVTTTQSQAADISVGAVISGEIHPGVYGRVEIGNVRPPVVYERPVVILDEPRYRRLEPVYLHVPPGHAKNWRKHCAHYNACGRPVYFVKSAEYEPGYRYDRDDHNRDRDERGDGDEHGHGNGKHKGH